MPSSSADAREKHTDTNQPSEGKGEPTDDWFNGSEDADRSTLIGRKTLTAGRIDSGVELALEAPVEALNATAKPPQWPKNDVREQIMTGCARGTTVAEIAAHLSLPLGATRFLVDDLVTQGYLRVHASLGDPMTLDERRELIARTLRGLRAL
ncbi:DUF742 domain-containing protein [Mycobacterium sp. NPDC050441]|uniref:DUF742 domain-containing protein n=1 Tax=Mycobacterium sp. NPDC050441 TaxID=3155403 RepID=UPI0033C1A5D8